MPNQRDGAFLALWREHGDSLTWDEYASRLTTTGDKIDGKTLKVWVNRHRQRLAKEYGVTIGPRRISAEAEFSAWPQLPREMRNESLYRFLEYRARERALGLESLGPSIRGRYFSQLTNLRKRNEIVRYDLERGLYRDKRSPEETLADPNYERVSETREVYEARQRLRRRS